AGMLGWFTIAGAIGTCVLLVSGCVNAIPMSHSIPAQLNVSVADGRSPKLHSGDRFAYWLWRDSDDTWHLRTTSARKAHHFQGRIHPVPPGTISELVGVSLEGGRRRADGLGMVDGDIALDFTTKGEEDGLDFKASRSECLEFDLRIDGDGDPGKIYIGPKQTRPGNSHFMLCP
ncbi:MAG TPA: hypothetical protein VMC06_10990, partial [Opitutaceae bacterium]|nr:hypothetical protein [Opitutaceae bacterium]